MVGHRKEEGAEGAWAAGSCCLVQGLGLGLHLPPLLVSPAVFQVVWGICKLPTCPEVWVGACQPCGEEGSVEACTAQRLILGPG